MAYKDNLEVPSSARLEARLGERLARLRLSRNITQKQLAGDAGIGIRTLRRFEAGEGSSLDTLMRLLIALGIERSLDAVIPDPNIRPVERVRLKGRERRRARPGGDERPPEPWSWGDGEAADD